MGHLFSLVGIGIVAFAMTNIDDLLVLVTFFADPLFRPLHIVTGQFAGIAALIAASLAGSLLSLVVPTSYLGLLGFLPIAIGLRRLFRREDDEIGCGPAKHASRIATVALVTISNGGDNLSLYIPLFSVHTGSEIAGLTAIFLVMTALWCAAGRILVGTRSRGSALRTVSGRALPFVMVGLGLYIIVKTAAWTTLIPP